MTRKEKLSNLVKAEALRLGFSACGISRARFLEEEASRLERYLKNGYHGRMSYLEQHFDKRLNPALLVPGAKSVISVLLNYQSNEKQAVPAAPVVSRYAYGRDYHHIIKDRLENLFVYLREIAGDIYGCAFCDSAPVLERAWARNAGLGWTGKNACLITPGNGSWHFCGELIVDIDLEPGRETEDLCGDCHMCMDACPTGALVEPRVIDAHRCISYHTISFKENLPDDVVRQLGNRIYGCDVCQDVCPRNKKSLPHNDPDLAPNPEMLIMTVNDWYDLTKEKFKMIFKDTAVSQVKYEKLADTLSKFKVQSQES
ncbi:MAG: tRNA epoxyqueuosine(34) reductase QueG [Bacteroidia bacterium]|nr:tRNA epoxyqueuosine(34) reductase QueG [Bacteroidia bacterium]